MKLFYHPSSLSDLTLCCLVSHLTKLCKQWESLESIDIDEIDKFKEYIHSNIPSVLSNSFTSECVKMFSKEKVHSFVNVILHPMINQLEVPYYCTYELRYSILRNLCTLKRLNELVISLQSPNTLRSKLRWHLKFYILYQGGELQLSSCFQSLSKLVVLDVSGLQIVNEVLESVGKHCSQLKQIIFCGHDPITDSGVLNLVKCKALEKIVIYFRDLNISDVVLFFLIQELPKLIWLECLNEEFKYVVSTSELMKHLSPLVLRQKTYKLRNFTLVRPLPSHIDCISKVFPDIHTLLLYQPVDHLHFVANFSKLKSLTLRHIPHLYNHVLLGALASVSKQLEELELYTIQNVDLVLIRDSCPNLRRLKLVFCEITYHSYELFKCNYFKNLKVLKIVEFPQTWRLERIEDVLNTIFTLSKTFVELDLELNEISNGSVINAISKSFENLECLETLNFHSNGQLSKDLLNNIWKYQWKNLTNLFISGTFTPEQSAYYLKRSFQTQLCIHLKNSAQVFETMLFDVSSGTHPFPTGAHHENYYI